MTYIKYPRTKHLPWSEGITDDDKVMTNEEVCWFEGCEFPSSTKREVVVTIKYDGENTSLYNDHTHARSVDSRHHASRDWLKNFWSSFRYQIPDGWRVCGENMYAQHSIHYDNLPSYFLGFSVWNENNICLSWPKTLAWFDTLGITPVETIYQGEYDVRLIHKIGCHYIEEEGAEGYVIRPVDCFHYDDFGKRVAKCVRKDHVQTDKHWMAGEVIPNGLMK